MSSENQSETYSADTLNSNGEGSVGFTDSPAAGAALKPGAIVDRYQLLAKLGEGGFGIVFLASHKKFPSRRYALKLVRPDRIASAEFSARFAKEIQAMGDLNHPNVVYATDAGEWNGLQYLAMDYVDGVGLDRLHAGASQLSIADACELVRQAAIGMQHVHEKERTHRDLKPSNLILDRSGVVRILDLGLAKLKGDTENDGEPLTATGQMMGTPDYMAPEQWEDSSTVDIRADIYSLGCTLFCLLSGRPPFGDGEHRSTVAKMRAHTTGQHPDICSLRFDVPAELSAILQKCLKRSADDRYQTPQELADALKPFAASAKPSALVGEAPAASVNQVDISTDIEANLASTIVGGKDEPDPTTNPTKSGPRLQLGLQVPGCMISLQVGMSVMLVAGLTFWMTGTGSEGPPDTVTVTAIDPELAFPGEWDAATSTASRDPEVRTQLVGPDVAEIEELQTILRDVVLIDASKDSLVNKLQIFDTNPNANTWQLVLQQAEKNQEKLGSVITRLEGIQSAFVIDQTLAYREMSIDLNEKDDLYSRIRSLPFEDAVEKREEIASIAESYQGLIDRLQTHEETVRNYLLALRQTDTSDDEPSAREFASRVRVAHFRTDADGVPVQFGDIGVATEVVRFNDVVQLSVSLESPQYIMLVALNADGSIQPLFSPDESEPQIRISTLQFPDEPDVYFGLTDGKGQQAFLVLTSDKLLPSSSDLLTVLESTGWTANQAGGIWSFDGDTTSQVFPGRQDRGSIQRLTADAFRKVCLAAKEQLPELKVTGFAFPVE